MIASKSSSVIVASRPSRVVPALFTRMSSRPWAAMAALTTAWAVAKSLTSPCTAVASLPPAVMRATTSSAAAALVW